MSELLRKSELIYSYLKAKPCFYTKMQVKPKKSLCTLHVKGLGFPLTEVTKADSKIVTSEHKEDLRAQLMLGHYSMLLMPAFFIEGCLSIFLKNEVSAKEYLDGKPIEMEPLFGITKLYADLF